MRGVPIVTQCFIVLTSCAVAMPSTAPRHLDIAFDRGSYEPYSRASCADIYGDGTGILFQDCGTQVLAMFLDIICENADGCLTSDCCVDSPPHFSPSPTPTPTRSSKPSPRTPAPATPAGSILTTVNLNGNMEFEIGCGQLSDTMFFQDAIAKTMRNALSASNKNPEAITPENVVIIDAFCSEGGTLGRKLDVAALYIRYEIIIDTVAAKNAGITSAEDVAIIESAIQKIAEAGIDEEIFLQDLSYYLEKTQNIAIPPEAMTLTAFSIKDDTLYQMGNENNSNGRIETWIIALIGAAALLCTAIALAIGACFMLGTTTKAVAEFGNQDLKVTKPARYSMNETKPVTDCLHDDGVEHSFSL